MKIYTIILLLSVLVLSGCNQSPLTDQIIPSITPTPSPIAFAQPTAVPTPQLQLPDNLKLEDLNLDLAQPENYDLQIDPIDFQNTQKLDSLNLTLPSKQ